MGIKLPETISQEEFVQLIKKVRKKHHKMAFMLGFYGCMRVSEVVKLLPENIDRQQRLIRIKQSKFSRDRNIPIPPEIIRGLNLLPIGCGARALQMAFRRYAKEVLNKDMCFHCLRHSGATHYLNVKKWDLRHVQQFLGHTKIDSTVRYTHVTPKILVDNMYEGYADVVFP